MGLVFFTSSFFFFNKTKTAQGETNEDLIISANTTWPSGIYTYRDITITNNATLTLEGSYTNDDDGEGVTINARNITVDPGAAISANGKGYPKNVGPGKGYLEGDYGTGAAYGGAGGATASNKQRNNNIYGDVFRPTDLGSGGAFNFGGAGGGAIIINSTGEVEVNGSISANGSVGDTAGAGGGSGGTVSIDAVSVQGNGSITAVGGNSPGNFSGAGGGGGGGGRISIYYSDSYSFPSANLNVVGGVGLGYANRSGTVGTVTIFNDETQDLTIAFNTTWPSGTYNYRDITITNNATLTLEGSYTTDYDGVGVTINARNITVDTGSSISANGKGYIHDAGPGKGYISGSYGSGAAHGGSGAAAALNAITQKNNNIYDINFRPTKLGSGGGLSTGGAGGGAIIINSTGAVEINGSISANGSNPATKGGGGSGGTVSIDAVSVQGSGSISATGGGYVNDGSGGSGGRISVYYSNSYDLSAGSLNVAGGIGFSGRTGDAGTSIIFNSATKDLRVEKNLILYKNEGVNADGELATDGNYYFNNLMVNNNASLFPQSTYTDDYDGSGVRLYLSGDLEVAAGSKIDAKGAGYLSDSGQGKGVKDAFQGGGSGHGGNGGDSYVGGLVGGQSYGNTMFPLTLGSGGVASGGGSGGGAIYIDCAGTIFINGDIDASGNTAVASGSNRGSGGAGGSIYIKSSSIEGTGNILANGGSGLQYSGGGGGGRIAIYSDISSFSADQISATGGAGGTSSSYTKPGEVGTIFIYDLSTRNVTASNDVTFEADQGLSPDGSFRNDGVYYFNNFTVSNNATVTIGSRYTNDDDGRGVVLNLDGNLTIENGSKITASGKGFINGFGPGKGREGHNFSSSGGSYGGLGGLGQSFVLPGETYGNDSATFPHLLGSSGGNLGRYGSGGAGGGAITIRVLGDIDNNGEIAASGGAGTGGISDWRPGGGSGGSIYLVCNNLLGSGDIKAIGGNGLGPSYAASGAGGGGRISIVYQENMSLPLENIDVSGGTGTTVQANGSEGTLQIAQMQFPSADFLLKNPNNNSTEYTNTLEVNLDPIEENVEAYSKSGTETRSAPPFYDASWERVDEGVVLAEGEGTKTVKAWLKTSDQLIAPEIGEASIIVDLTNPLLSLDQTSDQTEEETFTLSGTANDVLSGVQSLSVQVESLFSPQPIAYNIPVSVDGIFTQNIELIVGENQVSFLLTDAAGNITTQDLAITRSSRNQGGTSDEPIDGIDNENLAFDEDEYVAEIDKEEKITSKLKKLFDDFLEIEKETNPLNIFRTIQNCLSGDCSNKKVFYSFLIFLVCLLTIITVLIVRRYKNKKNK